MQIYHAFKSQKPSGPDSSIVRPPDWNAGHVDEFGNPIVITPPDLSLYAALGGRSGGQSLNGGTGPGEDLHLYSTSHATKGKIYFGANAYFDEVNDNLILPVERGIQLQSQGSPFALHISSMVSNGVRDNTCFWAYNMVPGTTNTRVDLTEPMLKLGMEGHYFNGSAHLTELNLDYMTIDGMTNKRLMAVGVDRIANTSYATLCAGQISFMDELANQEFLIVTAPGTTNKLAFKAGSVQSGNLFEWQNNSGTPLASIGADGSASFPTLSSPATTLNIPDTNFLFKKSSGAIDEKYWGIELSNTQMLFRIWNDALASANNFIELTRTGIGLTSIVFNTNLLSLNNNTKFIIGSSVALGVGGAGIQVRGSSPTFTLQNLSAAANNQIWTAFETNTTQLLGRVLNDALGSAQNWITVTRSGATVSRVAFPNGKFSVGSLSIYANNAAAITGGLAAGDLYRTGADPDPVCIVH